MNENLELISAQIEGMVRDFTSVDYIVRPKSEVRRRIEELASSAHGNGVDEGKNTERARQGWINISEVRPEEKQINNNMNICQCGHDKLSHSEWGYCTEKGVYRNCDCPSFHATPQGTPEKESYVAVSTCCGASMNKMDGLWFCDKCGNLTQNEHPIEGWEFVWNMVDEWLKKGESGDPNGAKAYQARKYFGDLKRIIRIEIAAAKKEAIAEHDATYHPITKHMEMVKDDKAAREEWKEEGKKEQKESDKQTLREGIEELMSDMGAANKKYKGLEDALKLIDTL
jgi:hypothetical protein